LRERTRLDQAIGSYRRIEREVAETIELIELGEAEGEPSVVADAEAGLEKLRAEAARRELESLLSGEADGNDCYLEVHAGAGGTEAQD
jgi:peptide chain release factor 2